MRASGLADETRLAETRAARRLRVRWFKRWEPALDSALQTLPELELLPHELYRRLMQVPESATRRAVLVTENDSPVALPILKPTSRYKWDPATQWLVPHTVFPCQPGYLAAAIEALRVDIWVGWWRSTDPPPPSPLLRSLEPTPTFGTSLEDYEAHWHLSSHFKKVKEARKRCLSFNWKVDPPGGALWTVRSWGEKWGVDPDELRDRSMVAEFLEKRGQHHTLVLFDKELPVAGVTQFVDGPDLVGMAIYRRPEYDRYSVGTRILALSFEWGSQAGFHHLDLGGGYQYKQLWAPANGERLLIRYCPEGLFRARQLGSTLRKVWRSVGGRIEGGMRQNDDHPPHGSARGQAPEGPAAPSGPSATARH